MAWLRGGRVLRARFTAWLIAGSTAVGIAGCTIVEVPPPAAPSTSTAAMASARPAALQPLVVPGDFPFECTRLDDDHAAAMGVPADGVALLFMLGEFPLDDRRISVGLDGAGRVLWLHDATTELGGRPGHVSQHVFARFRDDAVTGMYDRQEQARPAPPPPSLSDTAAAIAWYERVKPPELTAAQIGDARAVAAWAAAHRCDR